MEQTRIAKLCGHCETILRLSGRLVKRVNARDDEKVDCEFCGEYSTGGYFEVGPRPKKQKKEVEE